MNLMLFPCRKRTDCQNCWTEGTGGLAMFSSAFGLDDVKYVGGIVTVNKSSVYECGEVIDNLINH